VSALALLICVAGLACVLLGALRGGLREGLAMMLQLWLAAALLQLAFDPDRQHVLAAALLLLVRAGVRWALGGVPGHSNTTSLRR
jgi:hypothetical protein